MTIKETVIINIHENGCGHIILNRVIKYNALTFKMLEFLLKTLLNWKDNDQIKFVLFTSNSSKAFCPGGDIEELAESIINPIPQGFYPWQFIYVEYRLDLLIATYSKPIITILDGYLMGGGCGIGINTKYNICTENAICAMPECSIMWFPDCLFSYYLHSKMKHSIGYFIGLTGVHLDYKDLIYTNLVKYYIKKSQILQLINELLTNNVINIEILLDKYSSNNIKNIGKSKIKSMENIIDKCFGFNQLNDILKQLKCVATSDNSDLNIKKWANDCYYKLLNTSPLSLKVTMKLINETKYNTSIGQHAITIYNVGVRMLDKYNFYNGVKRWRAKKNKTKFDSSFAYNLKHNHPSIDLLDEGILSVWLELDARYAFKLQYDEYLGTLHTIDVEIMDRPTLLKIDDIVNHTIANLQSRL